MLPISRIKLKEIGIEPSGRVVVHRALFGIVALIIPGISTGVDSTKRIRI